MKVLLRFVRLMPRDFRGEAPVRRIVFDLVDLRTDDALQGVQRCARTEPLDRIAPSEPVPQADGIVIAIGIAEPQQQPACAVGAERHDEFLAQQPERRSAEDDHALLVQADHSFFRAEFEDFGELKRAR
jgi:hypothetical protein